MRSKLKEYSNKNLLMIKDKFKEIKEITGTDVLITGSIAAISLILVLSNVINKEKKIEEIDMNPAYISTQECEVAVDGKESIYICEEVEKQELVPELKEHYNNIRDSCMVNPRENNRIDCFDPTISDKTVKELSDRNKAKLRCLTNKKNQRIRCFRK
jgi:hypothetical protein